jgi:hypothetical protein
VGVDLLVQAIGVEPSTAWLPGAQGGETGEDGSGCQVV